MMDVLNSAHLTDEGATKVPDDAANAVPSPHSISEAYVTSHPAFWASRLI